MPDFPAPVGSAVGAFINDRPIVCGGGSNSNVDVWSGWNYCFVVGQDDLAHHTVDLDRFRFESAGISIANDVFWITGKPSTSASGIGM